MREATTGSALGDQAALFQLLTENMLDLVAIADLAGSFLYAGPSHRILGLAPQDFVGTSVFDYVHPEDLPHVAQAFAEFSAAPGPTEARTVTYRWRHGDGSYLWLETKGRFLFDAEGQPTSVFFSSRDVSDRVRAEESLRESEARLQGIIRVAPTGIGLVRNRVLVEVNERICEMTGYRREELVGQSSRLLYPTQEDFDFVGREKYAQIARHDTGTVETRWQRKDGQILDILLSSTPLDAHDHGKGVTFTALDITERKRSEQQLRQRLAYQDLLNRISTQAVSVTNQVRFLDDCLAIMGEGLAVSRAYVFEHDHAARSMDNTHEWCAAGVAPQKDALQDVPLADFLWWYETLRGGEPICYTDTADIAHQPTRQILGAQGILSILAVPLFVQGRYFGFVGFDDCLTHRPWDQADVDFLFSISRLLATVIERTRAEQEIRQRENLLQSVFELLPVGLWFADANGKLLRGNPAGIRIWGAEPQVGPEEYGVFKARRLPSGEEIQPEDWALARTVREGVTITNELLEIDALDGQRRTILNSTAPVFDEDGRLRSVIVVNQDITEQRLLESQLQHAMKMEAIGRLAGGVAHDFNNLLTSISGNVQLALLDLPPENALAEPLHEIASAADSAANLTRQLLAFSRKQLIEPRVVNLNELIASLHKMLSRVIGEDVKLSSVRGSRLGSVRVDPGQFEQILMNLAVNARDAMPEGGELVVETANVELDEEYCHRHADALPGRHVLLAVSDTGVGMSEETKSHLFEPFFTTKPKGRGTGLGLATIYGAVKQAGGSIEVYSELGEGSTFKIYLPRIDDKAPALEKSPGADASPGGSETILLVEDDDSVRGLAVRILTRLGYRVLEASDGAAALELAHAHTGSIDLLLTDVVMPGMNGRQLAERLATSHPKTRVLFTSGYTENAIAHRGAIDEGVNFIGKPYTIRRLATKVRELLDRP